MAQEPSEDFRALEERWREMAGRISLILQAMPTRQPGAQEGARISLVSASRYVDSILENLRGMLGRVREMDARLSEAQAGTVAKEEAAAVKREYEALMAKLQRDWASQSEKAAQEKAALAEDRAGLDSAIKDGDERLNQARLQEAEAKRHVISLQGDVARLQEAKSNLHLGMKEEWGRVDSARDELAKEIAIYTKKFREMRAWESSMKQEVQDEKDRVTRRDQTIRQLQSVIGEKDDTILELQARCQAEVSKSADATRLRKTAEGRADELQGMLNEARSRLKDKTAQGFKDLLDGFQGMKMSCEQRTSDAMGVAQSKNTSLEAEVGRVKQAMLDATKAIGDEAAGLKLLEEGMLPKAERLEASSRNIESVSTELQKLIQDRLEEAAAADRARDHRHQEDLASMRQQQADEAEVRKAALEAAKDKIEDLQQQLDAQQMCEQELSDARSKISTLEDMLVKSEQGRIHLAEAGGVGPSPERRHKRARGDTPRDPGALQSPPVSFVRRESGEMPEWHRAIAAADEVWHSFEPVILDDGVSHSWLLWYLSSVIEKEGNTDRFLSFLQSEAQGWFCASNVIQHGWTDPKSKMDGGCKRHQKKMCLGIQRVPGTTKLEFKAY